MEKQVKINNDLYVLTSTPYQIETDADRIFIPEDSFDEFLLINETLEDKLYKYNYNVYAVNQEPLKSYLADMKNQYFTIEALGDGDIQINIPANVTTSFVTSISYSVNDGDWTTITNTDAAITETVSNIKKGDEVRFKGIGTAYCTLWANATYADNTLLIRPTFNYGVKGNIMSLLYGDDFRDKKTLTVANTFSFLFMNDEHIIHSKDLVLPATTITDCCYGRMFYQATNLIDAPQELPAKIVPQKAYYGMFWLSGIKSCNPSMLKGKEFGASSCYCFIYKTPTDTLPNVDADYAGEKAFQYGLSTNPNVIYQPKIKCKVTDGQYSFNEVFYLNEGMIYGNDIIVENVGYGAFAYAFYKCTNLTEPPRLWANVIGEGGCNVMFFECHNLQAPMKLMKEGMILGKQAFYHTYDNCKSLTYTEPLINHIVNGDKAFFWMYCNCDKIERVGKIHLKEINGNMNFLGYAAGTNERPNDIQKPIKYFDGDIYVEKINGKQTFQQFMEYSSAEVCPKFTWKTLTNQQSMFTFAFQNCKNIKEGATFSQLFTLAYEDFAKTYQYCPNLKKITIPTNASLANNTTIKSILDGNPQSGTVYIKEGLTIPTGAYAIPTNWTIETF